MNGGERGGSEGACHDASPHGKPSKQAHGPDAASNQESHSLTKTSRPLHHSKTRALTQIDRHQSDHQAPPAPLLDAVKVLQLPGQHGPTPRLLIIAAAATICISGMHASRSHINSAPGFPGRIGLSLRQQITTTHTLSQVCLMALDIKAEA